MSTSNIAFLGVTMIRSINTFWFTFIRVFIRISSSIIFIFPPLRASMFFSMCECLYTSCMMCIYNADSVRYTIQPLSFHSLTIICVLLELHTSMLYFREIRHIKARKMRQLRRRLRLVLVIGFFMALFLFLI
jgi:hypothetical protein